jgi:hypothetical protein
MSNMRLFHLLRPSGFGKSVPIWNPLSSDFDIEPAFVPTPCNRYVFQLGIAGGGVDAAEDKRRTPVVQVDVSWGSRK